MRPGLRISCGRHAGNRTRYTAPMPTCPDDPAHPATRPEATRDAPAVESLGARLRAVAGKLRGTPLHPQWFTTVGKRRELRATCAGQSGLVIDVGCADGHARSCLPAAAQYVGLDYLATAAGWYGTRPDVFADARRLPFADASVDHALLLDVLEHIPEPDRCIEQLARVLKPGGSLVLDVPFMYPVHDAPLDFHRWTRHGLEQAALRHGFTIERQRAIGHPLETAALLGNIAMSQTVLNWLRQRNPLALLVVLLPAAVLLGNCAAWLVARLGPRDELMPHAYRAVWVRR